ncbi:MAG: Cytochrome c biogenesis protein CcsA [Chlamydiae bacterium]|nr:Cytochrome c biogenesis protein CcsA [Chlamydiota bacterium]
MRKKIALLTLLLVASLSTGFSVSERAVNGTDFEALKRIPVQHEGRLKPLDTVARNALLMIRGNQSLYDENRQIPPIEWMLDMTLHPERAARYPVFRIDHPDVLGFIEKTVEEGKYFSFEDLSSYLEGIRQQAHSASQIEENLRDSYQNGVLKLWQQITLYVRINNTFSVAHSEDFQQEINAYEKIADRFRVNLLNDLEGQTLYRWIADRYMFLADTAYFQPLFPLEGQDQNKWLNMGEGLLARVNTSELHPGIPLVASMKDAYQSGDEGAFQKSFLEYQKLLTQRFPDTVRKASFEVYFNQFQPFYLSILLYITAFVLSMLSWIVWPKKFQKAAFFLLIVGLLIHTFGIVARMYIEGRPPVTNLYSSAIFVGWGSVLLGIALERLYRNGIGTAVSTVIGSLTLIIAHHLSGKGDTMEMMRAVLNSNFWLSSHVVTITIGYSSTFLAGFLGCFYILRRLISREKNLQDVQQIGNMVYGIVCFSTLFSFVGTVLGGIWADQSWGRFWGWDPKENGALLIVLWNAIILHARWAGLVRTQGMMILVVFGNVITSFSWFGVNMLGIGLHSYGFMDQAFLWLSIFIFSQLLIMGVGLVQANSPQIHTDEHR